MKEQQMAALINVSALLFIVPLGLIAVLVLGLIIFSPVGTPLFKLLAAWCMRKKRYDLAAWIYARIYHWQELMGGEAYAREAAFAYEKAGNFRKALVFYEKAGDWGKLGQMLLETGHFEQAIEVFRSHNLPARLAFCYEQVGNYIGAGELYECELDNQIKALRLYEKALQQPSLPLPDRIRVRLLMARTFLRLDKSEESQAQIELAETLWNRSGVAFNDEHLEALHAEVLALLKR